MTISELKDLVDIAAEYAPDARVEVVFKKDTYELARLSQSGVLGDLFLELGEAIYRGEKNL